MQKFNLYWLSLLLLTGCSIFRASTSSWDPNKNAVTRASHQQVLDELDRERPRGPASGLDDLKVDFSDLGKVTPGKFEVYVFPKVSAQTNREVTDDEEYLGPPRVFEVTILAVNPCQQFLQKSLFAKLKPTEAFPAELGANSSRQCAIMEFTDKKLATVDKSLLKQDDQLMVRIFIDDAYNIHATDHVLFETRNQNRVIRRVSEQEVMNSGLSYFPMDLPAATSTSVKDGVGRHFSRSLDPIAVHQIRKRYNQGFSSPQCEGVIFTSKDPLGGKAEVGWCRGIPWPSYSENRRFFSVTQSLRVR